MPQGDAGGHFADTGGYGGNFGGAGGASRNTGSEHGLLGYGGMSPGGFNSTTYGLNAAGIDAGQPGFGARVAAARAAHQRRNAQITAGRRAKGVNRAGVQVLNPVTAPAPTDAIPAKTLLDYTNYRAPYNPTMDTTQYPDFTGLGSTPYGDEELGTPQQSVYGGPPSTSPGPHPYEGAYDTGPWGNLRGFGNAIHNAIGTVGNAITGGNRRQFGGPVAPGQQYTVGENGPETLQMGPGGGGQVIPNNPMDRMASMQQPGGGGPLGGLSPQVMQQWLQLMRNRGSPQQQSPGGMQRPPGLPQPTGGGFPQPPSGMPQPPPPGGGMQQPSPPPQMPRLPQPSQMPGQMGQGPGGGSFRLGDWRNRMGIEGLSRPPQSMGFGGSGLGIPGVMGQMRNRLG